MINDRTAVALWGVASRSCSILLAAFLRNCRQVFFSIRLVSVHVEHPYSIIGMTAAWKTYVFYRSGLTSIWLIPYEWFSMPLLVTCWCLPRLMRHCLLGRWTYLVVSENYSLVWRCRIFNSSTCIPYCVRLHGCLCEQLLFPDDVAFFRLADVFARSAMSSA